MGLADYASGQNATVRAAAAGWARVDSARAVVLVEGVSDQIAVETAAVVTGLDLAADGVVVVPIGGAQAIGTALRRLGADDGLVIGGLCDAGEELVFRRAVNAVERVPVTDRAGLEAAGFFVCVADLEDELIRAAGRELVEGVLDVNGDRTSFRTLQTQPAWRGQPFDAQVHRFIGAGARRKHRYAATLVQALGAGRIPEPLTSVLEHVSP